jgi:hypothetical protein
MNTTTVYEVPMTTSQIHTAITAARRELSQVCSDSYRARTADYLSALEAGLARSATA